MTEVLPGLVLPTDAVDNWKDLMPDVAPGSVRTPDQCHGAATEVVMEEREFEIVYTRLAETHRNKKYHGFMITWGVKKFGFGSFTFYQMHGDSDWTCDNECIGWGLLKQILERFLVDHPKRKHSSSQRWTKRIPDYHQVVRDILANPKLVNLVWYNETKPD